MKRLLYLLIFWFSSSFATDLMDIYLQALDNDPVFKAAYDNFMITVESVPQARSAFLPHATVHTLSGRSYLKAISGIFSTDDFFATNFWGINATQTLFNYKAWSQLAQAKASVKAAETTFNDAVQDLMLRTARAYFDVLLAQDTLDYAEAKKCANKHQLDEATERYKVGLTAVASVYEAKAAYDQSLATVISASNNQINQNENLRKLTNNYYECLAPLQNKEIPLQHPEPDDVNQWVDAGVKQNFKLITSRYNLEMAKENLRALSAGNWPTFSILGSANELRNDVVDNSVFVPKVLIASNISLAMKFPFFQGGLVQSQTRQAQSNFQLYCERLEQAYREVIVNIRIAFNTIIDGISKVQADKQTIISQQNSLESVEAQFQVGTRTMVDVVNAQQRLFEAQQLFAKDQYDLIYNFLYLKYLAGSLNGNDLKLVNSWLASTRTDLAPKVSSQLHNRLYK